MLALDVRSPNIPAEGRWTARQMTIVATRATASATRAGVAEARRYLRQSGVLRPGRSNRRVTSRTGWIRVSNFRPNITSLTSTRLARPPRPGPGRRGVKRGGRRVPGVFLHQVGGEDGPEIGFRRVAPAGKRKVGAGGVEAVTLPITRTSIRARNAAEPVVEREMRREVDRQLDLAIRRRLER